MDRKLEEDILIYGQAFEVNGKRVDPRTVTIHYGQGRKMTYEPVELIRDFVTFMCDFTKPDASRKGNEKLLADFRAKHFP